jgi:hypothetical protein
MQLHDRFEDCSEQEDEERVKIGRQGGRCEIFKHNIYAGNGKRLFYPSYHARECG